MTDVAAPLAGVWKLDFDVASEDDSRQSQIRLDRASGPMGGPESGLRNVINHGACRPVKTLVHSGVSCMLDS